MNFSAIGTDYDILNFSLTGTDTAISVSNYRPIKSILFQIREDVEIRIRENTGDTDYWTMKPGTTYSMDYKANNQVSSSFTLFQARTAAGTAILELWLFF